MIPKNKKVIQNWFFCKHTDVCNDEWSDSNTPSRVTPRINMKNIIEAAFTKRQDKPLKSKWGFYSIFSETIFSKSSLQNCALDTVQKNYKNPWNKSWVIALTDRHEYFQNFFDPTLLGKTSKRITSKQLLRLLEELHNLWIFSWWYQTIKGYSSFPNLLCCVVVQS